MASPANSTLPMPPLREPTTAHAYILPTISLLSILLLIVPFILHLRARNTGACALIGYLCLFNLMAFVNVLIWPDNNIGDWWDGAVLCDIEVKIFWPVTVGVAASTMAITRSLAIVLDVENADLNPSRGQKRRKLLVDLAICFAVPVIIAGLHVIVHTHRYIIVAIGGCTDSYFGSWATIIIIFIWPLVFTLISVFYAGLVITRLHRHRSSISTILGTHSLNPSRFLRLFILSLLLLFLYLPLNIFFFYTNVAQHREPYSWHRVHPPSWGLVPYLPAMGIFTFDRYVPVVMAVFVFAFFGTGTEARRIYAAIGIAVGLGSCFPRLLQERRPSTDGVGEKRGWMDKLSLVSLGKRYFAKFSSRGSEAATEMTSATGTSSSRKPSAVAIENASFTFQTSSYASSPPRSVSPSTLPAPAAVTPSLLSRLLSFLHISRPSTAGGAPNPTSSTATGTGGMGGLSGMDEEDRDLVSAGSRTHLWSPRALGPVEGPAGEPGQGLGPGGIFERLGSVGSEGTRVGVRVECVCGGRGRGV
ncbi:hypothetical protein VE03_08839 [Pseudogymnoascus sp. 23342-1-I1]|nr:hypothetical protein VE03_08839 [Pseudogymnoascus sp. 23342-1-I1]